MTRNQKILIIDYGSQYTQLIARRIREQGVYSEIISGRQDIAPYDFEPVAGIMLSGGPSSVHDKDAPELDARLLTLGIPILGVCYGLQLLAHKLGGGVSRSHKREYGRATMTIEAESELLAGLPPKSQVWMSHGDHVKEPPPGFFVVGSTPSIVNAALADPVRRIYGVQFHPEVSHTEFGQTILRNFLFDICFCKGDWTPASFIDVAVEKIQNTVGKGKVICALSGGVDSAVVAALLHKAIGNKAIPVFIDNGLLRKDEAKQVMAAFKELGMRIRRVDSSELFLSRLKGIIQSGDKTSENRTGVYRGFHRSGKQAWIG